MTIIGKLVCGAALALAATIGTARAAPAGETLKDCSDCPDMIAVPPGHFVMGATPRDPSTLANSPVPQGPFGNEGPAHDVKIANTFAIGKFEITVEQYAAFVEATGRKVDGDCWALRPGETHSTPRADVTWRSPTFVQGPTHPVVCVSWDEAKAYTAWLSVKTGKTYRLASEAEWEYAARAGTTTASYWGDDADIGCSYANAFDRTTLEKYSAYVKQGYVNCSDGAVTTAAVGSHQPNGFGLYDMLGNAMEWTEDCDHGSYDGAPASGRAWMEGDCNEHVLRGGSWLTVASTIRSSYRFSRTAGTRNISFGFRVVRDL